MLKYKIDIMQALKDNGYSTYVCKKNKLISQSTLTKIRNNIIVNTDSINILCNLLHCQPGDLLEHIPDEQKTNRE